MMANRSKDDLLAKISSYDILNHYLRPYNNGKTIQAGKHLSNPFLPQKQNTPSFNIYQRESTNDWLFKDFATGDEGDCFNLVMKLYDISFKEAVEKIYHDFGLSSNTKEYIKNDHEQALGVKCRENGFEDYELKFWAKYGIGHETLMRYGVFAVESITRGNKQGAYFTIRSNPSKIMFAYVNRNWIKLYQPFEEKKYKFQYFGEKEKGFIFGMHQLPAKGDILFITGGEKDVMSLAARGFNAISLNSETAKVEANLIEQLKIRFKNIIVLYDIDETGVKHSTQLSKTHGLNRIDLPEMQFNGKDISDFFTCEESLTTFTNLISICLKEDGQGDSEEKVVYNALELIQDESAEPAYLMKPILPQKGTAVIAGKPDTGKSQFARQLCIQVAFGLNKFLGFELNTIHKSAIYVATEDNMENTRYLITQQIKGLEKPANENLRFIFADTLEQEEIIHELNIELNKKPADIVIIDSFGDIFKGGDSNNNMAMRNTVKTFDKLAKGHNCLIVFVHHINKGAYRLSPGQEHIQGGAGLMQKVRLGIQLSEGVDNIRYFTVVKGNYCPKQYKQNSLVLHFSESNFLFTYNGELIPSDEIGSQTKNTIKDEKMSDLMTLAEELFGDKILSYSRFIEIYCAKTGKSIPTAKRAHNKLKENGIIIECQGSYRMAKISTLTLHDSNDEMPF